MKWNLSKDQYKHGDSEINADKNSFEIGANGTFFREHEVSLMVRQYTKP